MAIAVDQDRIRAAGWLRGKDFDVILILGLAATALGAGGIIALQPAAIGLIMVIDQWLLGFPHVAATFTRLVPDRAGLRQHRFLVFGLPVLVVAATAGLALGLGIWAIATIYFYWQWYHTVRQSWGVAQLYRRRAGQKVPENPVFAEFLFYLVPIWGLLHRLTTAPDHFLLPILPIAVPHVPTALANGVGVVACAGLAWWLAARLREAIRGELPLLHTLFSASHYLIFIAGYIVMDDLVGGWLVTNIWHTAQYLMIVWLFNENGAKKGRPSPTGMLWKATRGNRAWAYFLVCFLLAFPIYAAINGSMAWGATGVVIALIANQTLNFHHFIVDAVIWRLRRNPVGTPA